MMPMHSDSGHMMDAEERSSSHHGSSVDRERDRTRHMQRGMTHREDHSLQPSKGLQELTIPKELQREARDMTYTVRAQQGKTEIFPGTETTTYGYNGDFLGPKLTFKTGETVRIKLVNDLDEPTTFHWHGLEVAGPVDGGPHDALQPGEEEVIEFEIVQGASTLWFHPHPLGKTAEQVYKGLAGLIYIEDEQSDQAELPSVYGENDFPVIIQDKLFTDDHQLNYAEARHPDGTKGSAILVNGTLDPKLTVPKELVRLRLLNGSNARNYTFSLSDGSSFQQITTDGGFLNEPLQLEEITLTPSERAEIIVDFSQVQENTALVNEEGIEILPFNVKGEAMQEEAVFPRSLNDFHITEEEKQLPVTKNITLFGHMNMVTINGKKFDPNRMDLHQQQGVTEVWEIYNEPDMMGGMIHPFHVHGTQFKVISRDGEAPPATEHGWKDSISVKPGERVKIAISFKEKGVYMFHCHILEHEDNGMMGQIKVE